MTFFDRHDPNCLLHPDWNLAVSKKAVGPTGFWWFSQKSFQLAWTNAFCVHMTSWIWTSRVKTCAPLKPDLNKNILKITCFARPNDKTLELSKDRWHFSSCLFSIIRTDLAICQKCNWSLLISMILQNHWNYQGPVTFVVRHEPNYFLTFGLKSPGFKKCSRSTAFMVFAKIFKLAGANALLDVHTTRWIWASRAKTCASMKPFQNKDF